VVGDLVRQFEFVQANWMNNPNFPIGSVPPSGGQYTPPQPGTPAGGPDPVVGEHGAGPDVTLAQASGSGVQFPIGPDLVSVTAGEYFFLPSISTLASLAAA